MKKTLFTAPIETPAVSLYGGAKVRILGEIGNINEQFPALTRHIDKIGDDLPLISNLLPDAGIIPVQVLRRSALL